MTHPLATVIAILMSTLPVQPDDSPRAITLSIAEKPATSPSHLFPTITRSDTS